MQTHPKGSTGPEKRASGPLIAWVAFVAMLFALAFAAPVVALAWDAAMRQ